MVNTLSQFVWNQPGSTEYIRGQYPGVLDFIKAYWEWMETTGQPLERILILKDQRDIDKSLDDFVYYFQREFLRNIPKTIAADKRKLAKHIKDFYRARGSEKSYRLLFRILYGTEVEFYYPKEDMLRLSAGKWTVDTVIRTTTVNDTLSFVGRQIVGQSSGAIANVENVVQFLNGGDTVSEIYLSGLKGEFSIGETVECNALTETTYGLVTGATITSGGTAYKADDLLFPTGANTTAILAVGAVTGQEIGRVQSAVNANFPQPAAIKLAPNASSTSGFYNNMYVEINNGPGKGQVKKITSYNGTSKVGIIDGSWTEIPTADSIYRILLGEIATVKVKDFGVGYTSGYTPKAVDCSLSGNGNAVAEITIGAVGRYPGRYANSDGFLSDDKKIQDSFYYQDFSYVLKVEQEINNYRNVVKKLVHPAGLALFGIKIVENVAPTLRQHTVSTVMTTGQFSNEVPTLDLVAKYAMLEDLTDSQLLYDVSGNYPNGYNAQLGTNGQTENGDPTWTAEGLDFFNNYVSGLWTPVNNESQTILVIAKPDTLKGSPIGCIDTDEPNLTSGYRIEVESNGAVTFTTNKVKASTGLQTLACQYPAGTVQAGDYFFAALRYTNNTLAANVNRLDSIQSTFSTPVDNTDVRNNSRGYYIGVGGFVNTTLSQSLTGQILTGATLTGIPQTVPAPTPLLQGFFDGTVAYVIIYDRYLTDEELTDAYLTLKFDLADNRSISLP